MSKLDIENQNLSSENLQNIQWSETSIALCDFVTTYPLPQIVQVEEGYHGGSDENSLSSGQVLKIHTLTTERKLQCQDRHGKDLHIPVHTQKIYLKPENYDTVYQRVQDLSHAKPLPKYVEVTRGYYDVDSEVDYELSVDPGEVLEVIEVNESNIFTKKTRSMTFRNSEGVVLKIPFDCVAGFKPLVDNTPRMLSDVIPSDSNAYKYPFHFQFHDGSSSKVGVVKAKSTYDDHLIIASCGQGQSQVVFMIPQNLKVKVKVAVGTLKEDPEYENIRRSYHNFKSIEKDLKKSRSFKGRLSSSASEIVGIPVKNDKNDWVTFDQEDEEGNTYNPQTNIPMYQPHGDNLPMEKRGSLNGGGGGAQSNFATPMNPAMDPLLAQQRRSSSVQYPVNGIGGFNRSHNGSVTNGNGFVENHQNGEVAIDPLLAQQRRSSSIQYSGIGGHSNGNVDKYKEIREMSVQQLADNLRTLNMEKHVEVFIENQVDGELFLHLEEDELKDLNLTKFEIKKLNRFKDGWRPKID